MKIILKTHSFFLCFLAVCLFITSCDTNEALDTLEETGIDANEVSVTLFGQEVKAAQVGKDYILEGDIILDVDQSQGKAVGRVANRWENNTIPYQIGSGFSTESLDWINTAITTWTTKTNLTFVERTNQVDYIQFVAGSTNCSSNIGRIGGSQNISLAPMCSYESILHEIGHAIGFWHEMARSDRDTYLTVFFDRIQPGFENQFQTYIERGVDGQEYTPTMDYSSIMMYGAFTFAKPGVGPTMVRKDGGSIPNVRSDISAGDISGTNQMYPAIATPSEITIQGNNGKHVSSENGNNPMTCNRPVPGAWEKFEVVQLANGKVALKGNNGKYVSSENGKRPITCNRSTPGSWEEFTLENQGGNTYAIKGAGGYMSSENGNKPMTCNRPAPGAWEKFTIPGL